MAYVKDYLAYANNLEVDYEEINQVLLEWATKNRPTPAPHPVRFSAGWLSPNGDLFTCRATQHQVLAEYISFGIFNEPGGEPSLENYGWAKVYPDGLVYTVPQGLVTEKQIETFWEMVRSQPAEYIQQNLLSFIEIAILRGRPKTRRRQIVA